MAMLCDSRGAACIGRAASSVQGNKGGVGSHGWDTCGARFGGRPGFGFAAKEAIGLDRSRGSRGPMQCG